MRITLPSGAQAHVAHDISPTTLAALDEMTRAAVKAVSDEIDLVATNQRPQHKRWCSHYRGLACSCGLPRPK